MNENTNFYSSMDTLPPLSEEQRKAMENPSAYKGPSVEAPRTNIAMPPLPPESSSDEATEDMEAAEQESSADTEEVTPPTRLATSGSADHNFAELRKEKYRIAQERDEYARKLAQYEAALLQQKSALEQSKSNDDEDITIGEEDVAEGKHVHKMMKKYKKLEAELNSFKQKSAEELLEARIRAKYPDYDSVVNQETLNALAADDPELTQTIYSSPDVYNKAILAYKEIKKRGIVSSETYEHDKRRVQSNAAKPRPLISSTPKSSNMGPLSHANAFEQGLTDTLKAQLWKEMKEAMKG